MNTLELLALLLFKIITVLLGVAFSACIHGRTAGAAAAVVAAAVLRLMLLPLPGLRELFKSIDADSSGTITVEEMRRALTKWGHKIQDSELQSLMAIADVDGDGLIDYNEFVAATMHLSKLNKEELLQKAFKQLDKDGSGTITIEELSESLRVFGIYDDAKELLATADTNGDNIIDYAEFSWLLRNHNDALRGSGRAETKGQLARFF
eukprot:GHRQ01024059.1.p2 GENE.GHRQ01024059.1~~GHRQ01024059.1.p2  ORF type:complete len:207 (+),score=108.21 GHRQ01024059.1:713-1333(+)